MRLKLRLKLINTLNLQWRIVQEPIVKLLVQSFVTLLLVLQLVKDSTDDLRTNYLTVRH